MVVVLCDDYLDAESAFRAWVTFLQTPPSDEIAEVDKYCLRVETNDGQSYVFIDYRFENVFKKKPGVVFETINTFLDLHDVDDPNLWRQAYRERIQE